MRKSLLNAQSGRTSGFMLLASTSLPRPHRMTTWLGLASKSLAVGWVIPSRKLELMGSQILWTRSRNGFGRIKGEAYCSWHWSPERMTLFAILKLMSKIHDSLVWVDSTVEPLPPKIMTPWMKFLSAFVS